MLFCQEQEKAESLICRNLSNIAFKLLVSSQSTTATTTKQPKRMQIEKKEVKKNPIMICRRSKVQSFTSSRYVWEVSRYIS